MLTLSEVLVVQHVVRRVALHAVHAEDLHHGVAEAAHGLLGGALDEHHHLVPAHHLAQRLLHARGGGAQEPGADGPQTPHTGPEQVVHLRRDVYRSIDFACLFVCLFVCLVVVNKRERGEAGGLAG